MTRRLLVSFAYAALFSVMTSSASGQSKWWNDERSKRELGLTVEQSQQIEQIYQATLPRLRTAKRALDRQEASFSELMKRRDAPPEGDVSAAIERLESARSDLGRLRTLMLYQMRRILTPEQRAKLEAEHERTGRDRRGGDRSAHPQLGDGRPGSR